MAFTAPEGLSDYDINEGNTFEKQNRLASLWNDRPVFIKADPEVSLSGAKEEEGRYVRTDEEGYIIYDITITEKMPLYFYFYAPGRQNGEVFVNGESRDVYFTVNHWNTLCAGVFEPQDKVEIKMQILEDELEITESCFYYEDPDALREWADAAGKLNESVGAVNEITSSDLMFSTDFAKEETIVMSIPYEDSWRITCDGKRIKSEPVIEQLMSFQVPEGRHIIEMKYIPKGTGAGIAVSIIGIILFFGQIVYSRKRA